jgi:hypothetical protein
VRVTYKLFNECDQRLEVLLEGQMELIAVLEVDWDCSASVLCTVYGIINVLLKISPSSSMVNSRPHCTSPSSYLYPPSQPQNRALSHCNSVSDLHEESRG